MLSKGQPALLEIKDYFGESYFNDDGTLNRTKLGELIFSDASSRKWLNELIELDLRKLRQFQNLYCTKLCIP